MIGSLNTVPFRIFLIVPLGLSHIFLRSNSSTLSSSGVMVAHLTPTPCSSIACAASTKSEIVLPVFEHGELIGVLDVDSDNAAEFDEQDRVALEEILSEAFRNADCEFEESQKMRLHSVQFMHAIIVQSRSLSFGLQIRSQTERIDLFP